MTQLPITIISGYLGAGKTTLANDLLRNANGRKIGVLVNEFGELPIDADLIESADENMIAIAGGCVCCTIGNDLLKAIKDIQKLLPDHVIIEASGVALPAAVRASIILMENTIDNGVITVIDADNIRTLYDDPYMGDTVQAQLAAADLLIMNKTDLLQPEQIDETHAWLQKTCPDGIILERQDTTIDVILGLPPTTIPSEASLFHHDLSEILTSTTVPIGEIETPQKLARALAQELDIIRAKGFFFDKTAQCWECQIVGKRSYVVKCPANRISAMVFIGRKSLLDTKQIERLLAQH